jgi:hypothetical protein
MANHLKMAVIDDLGRNDPVYDNLFRRLEEERHLFCDVTWIDDRSLFTNGLFDSRQVIENIRSSDPELLLMDIVLRSPGEGRQDLELCNWLAHDIRVDAGLKHVPLLILSRYLDTKCIVCGSWRPWAFSKPQLRTDDAEWSRFLQAIEGLDGLAAAQGLTGPPKAGPFGHRAA